MQTIASILKTATRDDEYLLRFVLNKTSSELLLEMNKTVPVQKFARFLKLKKMHATGTPMQYIVGKAWFYGLEFKVSPSVLIPRPESELMVERALTIAREHKTCSVIDVGTGSGAIAIAISKNSNMLVSAIDISTKALTVARANARKHKAHIKFSRSDARKNFKLPKTPCVIVTANLPYLSDHRMNKLTREVRKEPKLALYGGPDGLDLYRTMLRNLLKNKAQTIFALLEIDPEQKTKLATFIRRELPKSKLIFHQDLRGDIRLAEVVI